jgi:hypothetical protein
MIDSWLLFHTRIYTSIFTEVHEAKLFLELIVAVPICQQAAQQAVEAIYTSSQ